MQARLNKPLSGADPSKTDSGRDEEGETKEALASCEALYTAVVNELQAAEISLNDMKLKEENENALQLKLKSLQMALDVKKEETVLAVHRAQEAEKLSRSYLEMLTRAPWSVIPRSWRWLEAGRSGRGGQQCFSSISFQVRAS